MLGDKEEITWEDITKLEYLSEVSNRETLLIVYINVFCKIQNLSVKFSSFEICVILKLHVAEMCTS